MIVIMESLMQRDLVKQPYITKATAQLMRDLGSIPSPFNSYLLNIGIESLPARMRVHCENALKVATYLKNHPKVEWIHYPGLEDDKYHEATKKYMPRGTCGVMCFGLKGDKKEEGDSHTNPKFIILFPYFICKENSLHPHTHNSYKMKK